MLCKQYKLKKMHKFPTKHLCILVLAPLFLHMVPNFKQLYAVENNSAYLAS